MLRLSNIFQLKLSLSQGLVSKTLITQSDSLTSWHLLVKIVVFFDIISMTDLYF